MADVFLRKMGSAGIPVAFTLLLLSLSFNVILSPVSGSSSSAQTSYDAYDSPFNYASPMTAYKRAFITMQVEQQHGA